MRQSNKARFSARFGEPLRVQRSLATICLAAALVAAMLIATPFANAAPPMINNDAAATAQDTPVVINVLANDVDDGPLFVRDSPTDPAHGSVVRNPDNTITYTPDTNYVGPDSFTYEGCDFDTPLPDTCDTATVTVEVEPAMTIGDVTLTEGSAGTTNATFQVAISSADPSSPVTVSFAAANGTALVGSDYHQPTASMLTIPATATSGEIVVPVVADTLDEPDENFVVNLSTPNGAIVVDGQAVGTITDDDPLTTVSVNDATVVEGNASSTLVAFNVTLGAPSGKPITVGYVTSNGTASAPGDFESTAAQVAFAPGETQKPANVSVVGDTTFEENETFTVTLILPVNAEIADGSAVGTIQNNDVLLGMNCDIVGTAGADTITGTAAGERICGMGGNDTISGGGGDDEIFGDAGNDRIRGDDGADAVEGGRGNDTLSGGAGGDSLEGGGGRDVLDGGAGDDTIDGGSGNDVARGGGDADVMEAGPGNDVFSGDAGDDRLEGGAGNDRLRGDAGNDYVDGSGDNDRVDGGPGNDQVLGLSGSDRVTGGAGNDLISGGGGADHVVFRSRVTVDLSKARARGEGRDRVMTVEVVTGSRAGDTLIGNSAPNTLNGGGGRDRIFGRGGADVLNGGPGNDVLHGEAGRDLLIGSSGNDRCDVGPGGGRKQSC
jgi:Ca2+-binding RTX toxin-like protein